MIGVNDHVLAALPTLLFVILFSTRFIVHRNNLQYFFDDSVKFQIDENFLLMLSVEILALSIINGIIIMAISYNILASVPFFIIGFALPASAISMLSTHRTKEASIVLASTGLMFLFEFMYFLVFGMTSRIFGAALNDWEITSILFIIVLIGGGFLLLILIARYYPELIETGNTGT